FGGSFVLAVPLVEEKFQVGDGVEQSVAGRFGTAVRRLGRIAPGRARSRERRVEPQPPATNLDAQFVAAEEVDDRPAHVGARVNSKLSCVVRTLGVVVALELTCWCCNSRTPTGSGRTSA